jgi:hypothetical protein
MSRYALSILALCKQYMDSEDEELKESLLLLLSSMRHSSLEDNHLVTMFELAVTNLSYDPNYIGDADMDVSESDDDEYSDDEDQSWKVRRASAKVIGSLVPFLNAELISQLIRVLVARMSDRVEVVKIEVRECLLIVLDTVSTTFNKDNMYFKRKFYLYQGSLQSFKRKPRISKALTRLLSNSKSLQRSCQSLATASTHQQSPNS